MQESLLSFVVESLRATPTSEWDELAKASGVPRRTFEKIAYGTVEDPRVKTCEQLARVFRSWRKRRRN